MSNEDDVRLCRYCGKPTRLRKGNWVHPSKGRGLGGDLAWTMFCSAAGRRITAEFPALVFIQPVPEGCLMVTKERPP